MKKQLSESYIGFEQAPGGMLSHQVSTKVPKLIYSRMQCPWSYGRRTSCRIPLLSSLSYVPSHLPPFAAINLRATINVTI